MQRLYQLVNRGPGLRKRERCTIICERQEGLPLGWSVVALPVHIHHNTMVCKTSEDGRRKVTPLYI